MGRLFDDAWSLLHALLGAAAACAPPRLAPLAAFTLILFIAYEVLSARWKHDDATSDVVEMLVGWAAGATLCRYGDTTFT